eukprot:sb/3464762/
MVQRTGETLCEFAESLADVAEKGWARLEDQAARELMLKQTLTSGAKNYWVRVWLIQNQEKFPFRELVSEANAVEVSHQFQEAEKGVEVSVLQVSEGDKTSTRPQPPTGFWDSTQPTPHPAVPRGLPYQYSDQFGGQSFYQQNEGLASYYPNVARVIYSPYDEVCYPTSTQRNVRFASPISQQMQAEPPQHEIFSRSHYRITGETLCEFAESLADVAEKGWARLEDQAARELMLKQTLTSGAKNYWVRVWLIQNQEKFPFRELVSEANAVEVSHQFQEAEKGVEVSVLQVSEGDKTSTRPQPPTGFWDSTQPTPHPAVPRELPYQYSDQFGGRSFYQQNEGLASYYPNVARVIYSPYDDVCYPTSTQRNVRFASPISQPMQAEPPQQEIFSRSHYRISSCFAGEGECGVCKRSLCLVRSGQMGYTMCETGVVGACLMSLPG